VLGDRETWDRIERIEVKDRIRSFPDRGMIERRNKGIKKEGVREGRWKWTKEGKAMFKKKMEKWLEDKGEQKREKREEVKREIQKILKEGQGKDGEGWKRGW